jgi:hypothetical protein
MSCAHGRRPDASRRREITSAAPTGDAIPTRTSDPAITRKLRAGLPDVPAASLWGESRRVVQIEFLAGATGVSVRVGEGPSREAL